MITIDRQMIVITKFNKILSIKDDCVCLDYLKMKLEIIGSNLQIVYLTKDDLEIHGVIHKVEFYE